MAIIVDASTKVLVQGMTGRAGSFYTHQAMRYGTSYVAGVNPFKPGTEHLGLPVFGTVEEAKASTSANASLVIVPAAKAGAAMIEAIEAEIGVITCVTERVPQHDMGRVKAALKGSNSVLIGPNSQGILTPEQCKIGVMPTRYALPGRIGIASRAASLTSEVVAQCSAAGLGQSTTVGIGGDALHGLGFVDCLKLFKDDADTDAVILIGEMGGREEEDAAAYLAQTKYAKPVVALIVGRHAPQGRRMGHAGTLSVFGTGSAAAKADLLERAGASLAENVDDVVPRLRAALPTSAVA